MKSDLLASIAAAARERPHDLALSDARRALTWLALQEEIERQSARFAALGPRPRVVVAAGNGTSLATAMLGALHAGGEIHGVSPRTPDAALSSLVRSLSAVALLSDRAAPGSIPIDAPAAGAPRSAGAERGGAILLTTSGTTGHPRIVVRGLAAVDRSAANAALAMGLRPSAWSLLVIPLFHTYGIDQLSAALLAGARVSLQDGFNPALVRAALLDRTVTHFPAVPTMLDALARIRPEGSPRGTLERVVSAGSALPARVGEAFASSYGIAVGQVYGSTELGTVTATRPEDPAGCVGRPLPGVSIRVLANERPDLAAPVPLGEEGLVAIATPSRFERYLDETAAAPEWFATGDLGRVDAEGRLWLTGRASLLIDVGAVKVNPLEVETVLMRHPDVREAVVLPMRFSATGSRLRAIVVPEPDRAPTRDALRRFARQHLVDYKVPRVFEIRADVPRSPTGKILRGELSGGAP